VGIVTPLRCCAQDKATTSAVNELEYSGEDDEFDGESSGNQRLLPDGHESSLITPSTTSKEHITSSPTPPVPRRRASMSSSRRRQQHVTRLSFVRKSPNRMIRPQLTSVSYTVRHDGQRRGRKTPRRPGRRPGDQDVDGSSRDSEGRLLHCRRSTVRRWVTTVHLDDWSLACPPSSN